jgi:hypothetical protein
VHRLGLVSDFRGLRTLSVAAAIAPGAAQLHWAAAKKPLRGASAGGVRAMASTNGVSTPSGLPIDLRGGSV